MHNLLPTIIPSTDHLSLPQCHHYLFFLRNSCLMFKTLKSRLASKLLIQFFYFYFVSNAFQVWQHHFQTRLTVLFISNGFLKSLFLLLLFFHISEKPIVLIFDRYNSYKTLAMQKAVYMHNIILFAFLSKTTCKLQLLGIGSFGSISYT